jgi:predicted DNA-binding mobile mystery protein A
MLYPDVMSRKHLQIDQLNGKMLAFGHSQQIVPPPTGWIKAIRLALGMSMQQLGKKLSITKQSVQEIERREIDGTISIKSLREAAKALDMKLVYGFVPNDGSLEQLIERKAKTLASEIVRRTSTSMKLEDQENSHYRLERAIEERAMLIASDMPKILWD